MAKLSDRERKAKEAGVKVDYSKSASKQAKAPVKLQAPLYVSKTPQNRLANIQKEQPIYKNNSKKTAFTLPIDYSKARIASPAVQKVSAIKKVVTPSKYSVVKNIVLEARKKQENKKNKIGEIFLPNRGFSEEETRESKPTLKEYGTGILKSAGEIANIVPTIGGFLAKGVAYGASKLGAKKYAENVRKTVDAYQNRSQEFLAPKTAGEQRVMRASDTTQLLSGMPIGSITRKTPKAIAKTPNIIAKTPYNNMEQGINKTVTPSSNIPKIKQQNIIQQGITKDIKKEVIPVSKIKPIGKEQPFVQGSKQPTFKPPTRTKDADFKKGLLIKKRQEILAKRNVEKNTNKLFTESDTTGKRSTFVNVADGAGNLNKVEIGKWDEAGNFKENIAEDGRKISTVIEENAKNLREGKKNNIKAPTSLNAQSFNALNKLVRPKRGLLSKAREARPGRDLHPEDREALTEYIDAVRLKKDMPEAKWKAGERLLEKAGVSLDQPLSSLANKAEDIVSGAKRLVTVLPGTPSKNYIKNQAKKIDKPKSNILNKAEDEFMMETDDFGVAKHSKIKKEADKLIDELMAQSGKGKIKLYHGTDSETARQIYKSGYFESGKNQPSFFTTSRKEAEEYARNKTKYRGKGSPEVIEIEAPKYAVSKNSGTGEIETHTGARLYFRGKDAFVKDTELLESFGRLDKEKLLEKKKERGLISSAKRASDTIAPEIRSVIEGTYKPRNTEELLIKSKNLVRDFPEIAEKIARRDKDSDMSNAVAIELIKNKSELGDNEAAIDLVERLAKRVTESGRSIQILSAISRLTPEGIGRFAQRQLDIANELNPKLNLKLSKEKYAEFYNKAKELQKLPDGYDKQFATAVLVKSIKDMVPSSIASKIGTFQTIAQLLNPKTFIRNTVGNTLFGGLENIKQVVATPADKFISLFTGTRTAGLPSLITQAQGFKKGLLQGAREVRAGVSIGSNTQFDLPQTQVFRGKIMGTLEKAMGMTLRPFDKAAYAAAFDDSIRSQMKANKVTKASPEMLESAHHDGLYRTFQDDNATSRFFVAMKNTLNTIGLKSSDGGTFGLGDLILKYPKTPGALVARGIDYSPAGFINTIFQISKPLFGKKFDQKEFVNSFSRALVGSTGLVGTGAILHKLGIISGTPEKDFDVQETQKTVGQGGYKINISALKRFAFTLNKDAAKKREGDTLISYDWAQPMAAPISLGIKLSEGDYAGLSPAISESIVGGVDTLQEQSLVTGLKRLFGYGDLKGGAEATLKGAPSSFVPTLSNQIRQYTDNTARSTYDPSILKESLNKATVKIPGLASKLPAQYDVLGKEKEVYQDRTNSLFNVFLNPSFVSKIKESPEAKMVLDLFEETGETSQFPRLATKKVKINGEDRVLNSDEYVNFQKYTGEKTKELFLKLSSSESFKNSTSEEKIKQLGNVLTDVGKMAKVELFGDKGEAKSVQEITNKINMKDNYNKIQKLLDEDKKDEAEKIAGSWSEEEIKEYKAIKSAETTKRTETIKKLLDSDPKKAVEYARGLREDQQPNIESFLLRKGNESWLKKYQTGKQQLEK